MKKMVLILAIAFGLSANAYSQYFESKNTRYGGGLFGRGLLGDDLSKAYANGHGMLNNNGLPALPGHDLEDDQSSPVGSGALLLLTFGAAYAVVKKHRKE